jgi:hypothetical protein
VRTLTLRRVARYLLLASVPVLVFLALRWSARTREPAVSAEETVLAQQNAALQTLVDAADRGSLVSFAEVLVVVDQRLVQDLLRAALPIEGPIGGFRVRLESADAAFQDGLALVHLTGKATLVESSVSADLRVYGGLEVVNLDPQSGRLRCEVRVFGVDADHANLLGIDEALRDLAQALSHGGLASLLRVVEIPVRIDDHLSLPAVDSKRVRIRAAEVKVRAGVAEVKAFGGKLWVTLAEQPESGPDPAPSRPQARP